MTHRRILWPRVLALIATLLAWAAILTVDRALF